MKTLTVRGLPKEVHEALQVRARLNRRSVNQQVIAELVGGVGSLDDEAEEVRKRQRAERILAEVERIRGGMARFLSASEIDEGIGDGRKF